ncbi:hypothetical protein UlMin_041663 [Ulmus minor]
MSSPIIAILGNETLTSDNFIKWKSNMNIVLICENYKYVLMEECPLAPAANATRIVRDTCEKWIEANNKACCYLLAGMSDVIRTKHEGMEIAYEIMESLQLMVGHPSEQSRHEAIKAFVNLV